MKVEFLAGAAIGRAISRLIRESEELHWAVAWGSLSPMGKLLVQHSAKFRNVTIGAAFSQTDPDLVDALIDAKHCYLATRFPGGTYHPKVYCFRSGGRVTAVVGSANFTSGGLGRNHEAAVLLAGSADDRPLHDLLDFTVASARFGEPVTEPLATRYRLSCNRAARLPKAPRDPFEGLARPGARRPSRRLLLMSWTDYARSVREAKHHDVGRSLDLLRTAQGWLASVDTFRALKTPQRKALAGVLGSREKSTPELDQEWGWFGSMSGMGDFANRVRLNDSYLARAVDSIPRRGEVTRAHFDRFAQLFTQAFRNSHRVGGVPTASRLLAMKRPDVFLCLSGPNMRRAAEELGFARTAMRLETYWDAVVETIRLAEWYNEDKPVGEDGELWEGRAAMLDALLYQP